MAGLVVMAIFFTFDIPVESTSAVIHICYMHCGVMGTRIGFPVSAQNDKMILYLSQLML